MMKEYIAQNNIFDFATSELSHSAFFAWLISQADPKSDYTIDVRTKSLEFINECLKIYKFDPITELENINSVIVKRELKHIDIVAFITTKTCRKIGLIIEKKVGAQESRKNQLREYFAKGTSIIDNHFNSMENEKVFIYLKSGYDFDDPLTRFDKKRNIIPTNFKKINFQKLYAIFPVSKIYKDSILRSYTSWIKKNYDSVMYKLNIERLLSRQEGSDLLTEDHIGQTYLIKNIFVKSFNEHKNPICSEIDKNGHYCYYYTDDMFIKLGYDRGGSPWSELWFPKISDISYFYRIQLNKPDPLFHVRLGYWDKGNRSLEKQSLHEKYLTLIEAKGLTHLKANLKFNSSNLSSCMSAFKVLEKSIEDLQMIEGLHFDFISAINKCNM